MVYLLCGIPLSWWLWYKRLYNGAKADSTLGFLGFFLWFALHCAFCIWAAIGEGGGLPHGWCRGGGGHVT